ncbi:MAG: Dabb family protein [Planctomycetaceae bacterium]|nr:Dabb family protein [Planctomycetaceae bacterium]
MLAHIVYFTLKDNSAEAKQRLVDACHRYLKDHPGVSFFAAGIMGEEFEREVNDKDYDVSLHVYFEDKAAHDVYQTIDDHLTFIAENKENWEKVRVFDSYVTS